MPLQYPIAFSIPTIIIALGTLGWQSTEFWAVLLVTVLQIISTYLLPRYWVGWKALFKKGLLITLALGIMCIAAHTTKENQLLLMSATLMQTVMYALIG